MANQNLVWTKLASGNVWWVAEKVENPPEEIIAGLKKDVQVVKYFNPDEPMSVVKNPNHIVDYEIHKEEYIRKGLSLLKKKPGTLKEFKDDILEAERRVGGDLEIIEKLEPKKPSDSTPRKSIVAEIFKTPVVEKKAVAVEKRIPPASAPAKISLKKIASPRKSKGPTPQLVADGKKFHCEVCGFGTDRMGVLTTHRKTHADGSIPVTPAAPAVQRTRISIPVPSIAAATPEKAQVGRKPSARQALKATPVASPKRTTQPRKRKLATPEVTTDKAKEILADWSDGDEEGVGEPTSREARKKAKTSKDLFDSLFQATKATSGDSTDDVKPPKEDENASDRRSDDEMDEDLALLSGSNAPISLLQKEVKAETNEITPETKEVTPETKEVSPETMELPPEVKKEDEVVEKIEEDLDAQFNELMSETAFKLPEFDAEAKPSLDSSEVKELPEEGENKESEIAKETVEAAPEKIADTIEASAKQTEMPELKSEEATTSVEKSDPGLAVTRSLRSSLSPEKVKSAEVPISKSPAPVTPKKPQDRAASPIKTYPSPSKAAEVKSGVASGAQNDTVKVEAAETVPPAAPVYARKSAPKPITEDRPKRTTRGRRASASKAAVVEPSVKADGPAKVETPIDEVQLQPTAPVASVASVKNESEAETKSAEVVSSAIVSQQTEVKVEPETASPVGQTVVDNLEAPKIPDSNLETKDVAEAVTNHTKTEKVKPVETPTVTDVAKKPSATSAPTASALALAQRKQQQQQRGVAVPTPKRQARSYPAKKTPVGSSSDTTQGKPTATVKPTVSVEDDSISRQALQVQKGNLKSSSTAEPKEVEHVVHLVPVQNADGSVSYMLLSLNDSDQLQLDQFEGQSAPSSDLEAVYLDKPVDCETLMNTICPPTPSQQQQQVQIQLPQVSQAPSRQPTASQQVKQISAAAAATKASTSQPVQPQTTQFISTDANTSQQFIIQQPEGQDLLSSGALVQSEDGSFVDLSQLASGDNNIYFMTEDGSIIDPASVNGIDLQQFFTTQ